MSIEDFLPEYIDTITQKNEFYENNLPVEEFFPQATGELMKHQHTIARLLSSRTPYDVMLLAHQMGTGKTCSVIGAIEQIRHENSTFSGAIILANGKSILDNFINELAFKCTSGEYIPDNYDMLSEGEKTQRKRKLYETYYSINSATNTFQIFAKNLTKMKDEQITERYSNKIIVIDEVHNIRSKYKSDESEEEELIDVYEQIHRMLHLIKNYKIILMSGTPISDLPMEIADVMNLILPMNEQLPTKKDFNKEFLIQQEDGSFIVNPSGIEKLKSKFKGRTSFLRAMRSKIDITYEGKLEGQLTHINVVAINMSGFQSQHYKNAYEKDTHDNEQKKSGIYSNSSQASLFVFPDGSYGEEGFNKYLVSSKSKKFDNEDIIEISLSPDYKKYLQKFKGSQLLEEVRKSSCKYAEVIEALLKNNDRISFVYCFFVKGSGAVLFSLLLELFGFTKANGLEKSEKRRYALVTGKTASTAEFKRVIERSNRPDNKNGKFIQVIIGSSVMSEGISLSNIQDEYIISPDWKYSKIEQTINRGIRFSSHNDLINANIKPHVRIYQQVAIPLYGTQSIDLYMYELAQIKDKSIQRIIRLIEESSIDCILNYDRNFFPGENGDRECRYSDCRYECDEKYNPNLDFSTYQLYYTKTYIKPLKAMIFNILREGRITFKKLMERIQDNFSFDIEFHLKKELQGMPEEILSYEDYKSIHPLTIEQKLQEVIFDIFRSYFMLDYDTLKKLIHEKIDVTDFQILLILSDIITTNMTILNKYGFVSYLRENGNIYFLLEAISFESNFLNMYYTENPIIYTNENYSDLVVEIQNNNLPFLIDDIFSSKNENKIIDIVRNLPHEVQNMLLEKSIDSEKNEKNKKIREVLLKFFEGHIKYKPGLIISTFNDDNIRCYQEQKWTDCPEDIVESIQQETSDKKILLENHPLGYYGLVNPNNKTFCLKETNETAIKKIEEKNKVRISQGKKPLKIDDTRLKPSGKSCASFTNTELDEINKKAVELNLYKNPPRDSSFSTNKILCKELSDTLRNNFMIVDDKTCGTSKKKKSS